ncbi:MAG: tyrosine recombinase [Mariprofundales bacterium]
MSEQELLDFSRVENLLQRFAMQCGWSANTLEAYIRDLRHAILWLNNHGEGCTVFNADTEILQAYLVALHQSGMASSTQRRRRSALRVWYQHLCEEGLRNNQPMAHVPAARSARTLPHSMTETEIEQLINSPDVSTTLGLRDRCMLELLYATGMRVSELVTLKIADIELTAGLVHVTGKGGKQRLIPYGEEAAHWLQGWLETHQSSIKSSHNNNNKNHLFPGRGNTAMTRQNFWQRLKLHAKVAGMAYLPTPHTLRHAFATHLLQHGAGLRSVQLLLGHASITTTEIYTHINKQRLLQQMDAAHPLGANLVNKIKKRESE